MEFGTLKVLSTKPSDLDARCHNESFRTRCRPVPTPVLATKLFRGTGGGFLGGLKFSWVAGGLVGGSRGGLILGLANERGGGEDHGGVCVNEVTSGRSRKRSPDVWGVESPTEAQKCESYSLVRDARRRAPGSGRRICGNPRTATGPISNHSNSTGLCLDPHLIRQFMQETFCCAVVF